MNTREKVSQFVKQWLMDTFALDEVTDESNMRNDLHMDSLDTLEFVMECEKEYNIVISDSETETIRTVGEAIDLIVSKL